MHAQEVLVVLRLLACHSYSFPSSRRDRDHERHPLKPLMMRYRPPTARKHRLDPAIVFVLVVSLFSEWASV